MHKLFQVNLLGAAVVTAILSGCGDVKTTIVKKESVEVPSESNNDSDYAIESMGRLAILSGQSADLSIFDLDNGNLLESFALTHSSNTLTASPSYRYAVINSRNQNYVGFIDGGLWREDHVAHQHDYAQTPLMSAYELTGSAPTHLVKHDGQMAIFYDGNTEQGTPASVQVATDIDITNETSELATVNYDINMHGVAEPRGEHLLSSVRRDDAQSTSANKILPDQVGVYHRHEGTYELEQLLEVTCPNLHGAAQNHDFVAFGCSDGVLIAHQHGDQYEADKIANIDELGELRIGALYGHEASEAFIGIASSHGGGPAILVSVNPHSNEMEALEWQPTANPVAYSFSHQGEHFLVLDEQGFLNVLSLHEHNSHTHWELHSQLDISEQDVTAMPDGMQFSMTVAQNGLYVYVGDPIAQHVVQIDLQSMTITSDIELSFAPSAITWLGIAETTQKHH